MQSIILRNLKFNFLKRYASSLPEILTAKIKRDSVSRKYSEQLEKFVKSGKIISNSVLDIQEVRLRKLDIITSKKERKRARIEKNKVEQLPLALSQLCDVHVNYQSINDEDEVQRERKRFYQKTVFPYSRFLKVENVDNSNAEIAENFELDLVPKKGKSLVPNNWLKDYELYNEAEEELMDVYGTPDRNHPISNIPCHGCGALLHCKE